MSNSFLDEIEEEFHSQLLEKGNLGPRSARPNHIPEPRLESSWISQSIVARVQENLCTCGAKIRIHHGIFLRRLSKSGASVDSFLPPQTLSFPLPGNPLLEVTPFSVQVCPSCLPSKGFKEISK